MAIFKTEVQKRVARFQRIFQEFPWIWALKSNWAAYRNTSLRVSNSLDDLRFLGDSSPLMRSVSRVAIHCCTNYPNHFDEYCIVLSNEDRKDKKWARFILERVPSCKEIVHLAIEYRCESDGTDIVIVRIDQTNDNGRAHQAFFVTPA